MLSTVEDSTRETSPHFMETTMVRKSYTPSLSVTQRYGGQQVYLGATKQNPAHPYAFINSSVPGRETCNARH